MKSAAGFTRDENHEDAMALAEMLLALRELPQLTVALVDGPAFGGGAGLVAACDYAVATKGAKFAFSEVKLGLVAATISPHVVDAIGPRRAKSLFATGRMFDAAFAEKIGLVDELVAGAADLDDVMERMSSWSAWPTRSWPAPPAPWPSPRPWSTTSPACRSMTSCSI